VPAGSTALRQVYNALWYPALPFALLATGGRDPVIRRERMGRGASAPQQSSARRVWLHAASVGEIEAVRPVLRRLGGTAGGLEITVTTMTLAGRDAARRRLPALAASQLAPLDFAQAVRAFLARLRPHLILIAETELWPNFFHEGARAEARVVLINGRMSARSLGRYRLVQGLIGQALAEAEKILVQTALDAERFRALGAPADRVFITGNTKFDLDDAPPPLRPALARFAPDRPILVAGSTAPGEERIVLAAYRQLLEHCPSLALVLAPRHLERVSAVESALRDARFDYVKASNIEAQPDGPPHPVSILLLDTMGELRALYRRASIAFVGGSMAPPRGGQSLAEPASVAVPVLFGPHYENQRELGDALIAASGGVVIHDEAGLADRCARWLADDDARRIVGAHARGVMERLADGAANTVRHLQPLLARG
jgi:3-deoxy-D-manno-octulosonic-acid transferase